jgi:hypothetical protein
MSSILDLIRQPDQKPIGTWRAVIASTPAGVSDPVAITIPAYSGDLQWGPCRWTPRVEPHAFTAGGDTFTAARVVLPQRGDQALASFDENTEPWVVSYGFPA